MKIVFALILDPVSPEVLTLFPPSPRLLLFLFRPPSLFFLLVLSFLHLAAQPFSLQAVRQENGFSPARIYSFSLLPGSLCRAVQLPTLCRNEM